MFVTDIESDRILGEHWMILDGLAIGAMPTRVEAEETLAAMVAELRTLPEHVYLLAHAYMTVDELLPLSKAVERAGCFFAPAAQSQGFTAVAA